MVQLSRSRRWGPADSPRVEAAEVITGPVRHGLIDGVEIDFRHPDIDPDDWEPRPWWHLATYSVGSAGLVFPSDGELQVPPITDGLKVEAGDRVRIASVAYENEGPLFLHPHDSHVYEAQIVVDRANGATEQGSILTLFGVTSLRMGNETEAFRTMAARVCSTLGLERLNDFDFPRMAARNRGLVEEATYNLRRAESAFYSLDRMLKFVEDNKTAPDEIEKMWGNEWWNPVLESLINAAAYGGYLLARSETDGAEGAIEAATKRKMVLDEGRLANKDIDGRRLRAREIWAANPRYTLNQVALMIALELKKDKSGIMASIKEEVPETSPSFARLQK